MAHAILSARLIGRQYHRRLQETLGCRDAGMVGFGRLLAAMAAGQGETAVVSAEADRVVVDWSRGRALDAIALASDAAFTAWAGLWEGCLATHDRFLRLAAERTEAGARLVVDRRTRP
jgi:hypothetical protein